MSSTAVFNILATHGKPFNILATHGKPFNILATDDKPDRPAGQEVPAQPAAETIISGGGKI
jgi:hypothetical protein